MANKQIRLSIIACLLAFNCFSQQDTISLSVFERISLSAKDFKPDTTAPPFDRTTKKIIELRRLKGGFNINEALDYKIGEDRKKNEIPNEELNKLQAFFTTGNGKRWLDNAVTWIYRKHFTKKELNQLVRFYKTSGGQKMATQFPEVMMESLKAAEMIKELYTSH